MLFISLNVYLGIIMLTLHSKINSLEISNEKEKILISKAFKRVAIVIIGWFIALNVSFYSTNRFLTTIHFDFNLYQEAQHYNSEIITFTFKTMKKIAKLWLIIYIGYKIIIPKITRTKEDINISYKKAIKIGLIFFILISPFLIKLHNFISNELDIFFIKTNNPTIKLTYLDFGALMIPTIIIKISRIFLLLFTPFLLMFSLYRKNILNKLLYNYLTYNIALLLLITVNQIIQISISYGFHYGTWIFSLGYGYIVYILLQKTKDFKFGKLVGRKIAGVTNDFGEELNNE